MKDLLLSLVLLVGCGTTIEYQEILEVSKVPVVLGTQTNGLKYDLYLYVDENMNQEIPTTNTEWKYGQYITVWVPTHEFWVYIMAYDENDNVAYESFTKVHGKIVPYDQGYTGEFKFIDKSDKGLGPFINENGHIAYYMNRLNSI